MLLASILGFVRFAYTLLHFYSCDWLGCLPICCFKWISLCLSLSLSHVRKFYELSAWSWRRMGKRRRWTTPVRSRSSADEPWRTLQVGKSCSNPRTQHSNPQATRPESWSQI